MFSLFFCIRYNEMEMNPDSVTQFATIISSGVYKEIMENNTLIVNSSRPDSVRTSEMADGNLKIA